MQRGGQVVQTSGEGTLGRVTARRVVALLALASLASMVQGCREDEQNRPLIYDKGTYLGQADEELSPDQVEALRRRAAEQQM